MSIPATETSKLFPAEAPLRGLHFATGNSEKQRKNSERLAVLSSTESSEAQDFRQERGTARCYFAARTAKTAKGRWCPCERLKIRYFRRPSRRTLGTIGEPLVFERQLQQPRLDCPCCDPFGDLARSCGFSAVIFCWLGRQVRGLIHTVKNSTAAAKMSDLLSVRRPKLSRRRPQDLDAPNLLRAGGGLGAAKLSPTQRVFRKGFAVRNAN